MTWDVELDAFSPRQPHRHRECVTSSARSIGEMPAVSRHDARGSSPRCQPDHGVRRSVGPCCEGRCSRRGVGRSAGRSQERRGPSLKSTRRTASGVGRPGPRGGGDTSSCLQRHDSSYCSSAPSGTSNVSVGIVSDSPASGYPVSSWENTVGSPSIPGCATCCAIKNTGILSALLVRQGAVSGSVMGSDTRQSWRRPGPPTVSSLTHWAGFSGRALRQPRDDMRVGGREAFAAYKTWCEAEQLPAEEQAAPDRVWHVG